MGQQGVVKVKANLLAGHLMKMWNSSNKPHALGLTIYGTHVCHQHKREVLVVHDAVDGVAVAEAARSSRPNLNYMGWTPYGWCQLSWYYSYISHDGSSRNGEK
jgi:hypothetical protein